MKIYRDYEAIPKPVTYIGSGYPDGTMDEATSDALAAALAPVCLIERDSSRHYFETAKEIEQ